MLNKKILFILLIVLLGNTLFIVSGFAQGLTLNMETNKDCYRPGEEVILNLKFTGVTEQKTNSLGISIGYDNDVLELVTNNPEFDIVNGYIPFNSKAEVGKAPEKYIRLDYIVPGSYKNILENEIVASIHFKVKHGVNSRKAQIAILEASMLYDENIYHISRTSSITEIQVDSNSYIDLEEFYVTDENNKEIHDLTGVSQININTNIKNNQSESMPVSLIAVLYDENNTIMDISIASKTIGAVNGLENFETSVRIPDQSKVYRLKIMFWNGFQQLSPLKNFYGL